MEAVVQQWDQEQVDVWENRYNEARAAGLPHADSLNFAISTEDVGLLRRLVRQGVDPELIARIV